MASQTRARRAISTALALVLAVETVSAVAVAAASRPAAPPAPAASPAGAVLAAEAPPVTERPERTRPVLAAVVAPAVTLAAPDRPDFAKPVTVRATRAVVEEAPAARTADRAQASRGERLAQAAAERRSPAAGRTAAARPATFRGRNHVWIPTLGISRSVAWFPCERQRPPDNLMYRWGCAGANNVYLMGHAHSVMKPLHDAYVSGRLHKGMKAWYADASGRVRVFAVRWWKVTRPTTDAAWAWAPQRTSSMTLQTCVGRNSQYRLMVRLVEVAG